MGGGLVMGGGGALILASPVLLTFRKRDGRMARYAAAAKDVEVDPPAPSKQ